MEKQGGDQGRSKDHTWEQAVGKQAEWWKTFRVRFGSLSRWLREITPGCWGDDDDDQFEQYVFIRSMFVDDTERAVAKLRIYTEGYIYSVVVCSPSSLRKSYLGATMTCRMARAGEEWARGNDLPDGEYCEDTWGKIKNGIVRNEMVKLDYQKTVKVIGAGGEISEVLVGSPEAQPVPKEPEA